MSPPASARFAPRYLSGQSAWTPHMPFAYDLIAFKRPEVLVELGTWYGDSFFCFCQSIANHAIPAVCYAVDHWQGDSQAGEAPGAQFQQVQQYCSSTYSEYAYLIRSDFESASREFADASVDFLHFDGHHTYESIRADVEAWLPKLRPGAVALFHDIRVRNSLDHPGFGVWRIWDELKNSYPAFEFSHGHGLGVLVIGDHPELCQWLKEATTTWRDYYVGRGRDVHLAHAALRLRDDLSSMIEQRDDARAQLVRRQAAEAALQTACDQLREQVDALNLQQAELGRQRDQAIQERDDLRSQRDQLLQDGKRIRQENANMQNKNLALLRQHAELVRHQDDLEAQLAALGSAKRELQKRLKRQSKRLQSSETYATALVNDIKAWSQRSWFKRAFHRLRPRRKSDFLE